MNQAPEAEWSALVIDDDAGVRQSLRLCLEADGARVLGVATPEGALEAIERGTFDIVLLDLWLGAASGMALLPEILRRSSSSAVVVITAYATFDTAVEAMRMGAVDYLPKPFTPDRVRSAVRRAMSGKGPDSDSNLPCSEVAALVVGEGPAQRAFRESAERVAKSECAVLLRGESGTGKNVMARWLHEKSNRAQGPFVSVNCPALSGDMMASVLFGHKKGAFTGALSDAPGKVQLAEHGTLFLDEVGDLGLDAQTRLLRFLNDKTFERVGDPTERSADVRVLAATNRPIEELVARGAFREDLFFRLDVVTLTLSPLRERRDEALQFARHWLGAAAAREKRALTLSEQAEAAILAHDWPGNLRELRNAIERASVLAPTNVLKPEDLGRAPITRTSRVDLGAEVSLSDLEREHIARVVARSPSLEAAARTLAIDASTLQRKRKRYGLA